MTTASTQLQADQILLTDTQVRAVDWDQGSFLLTATAGSGKTRVLVERFVRAVDHRGLPPERILAITFTEKAAHELRMRVRERLAALGRRDAAQTADASSISTIHGLCARLLRRHAFAAGLDPRFSVLDDAAGSRLRARAFDAALADFFASEGEPAVELAAAFGMRALELGVPSVYDDLRAGGHASARLPVPVPRADVVVARAALDAARQTLANELSAASGRAAQSGLEVLDRCAMLPDDASASLVLGARLSRVSSAAGDAYNDAVDQLAAAVSDRLAVQAVPLLDGLLERFGRAYARLKAQNGTVDFDDLEIAALGLLRDDGELRRAWVERHDLIMVDEFQDINSRQSELVGLLERHNLFVVGDAQQSIYGFRGAAPELFDERRHVLDAGGAVGTLAANFRSLPDIAAAVNAVFAPRLPGYVPLQAMRPLGRGEPVVELLLTDTVGWGEGLGKTTAWRRAEAATMAARLAELSPPPGETVVLLRASTDMAAYDQALAEHGLRALAVGGGYWRALETTDMRNYLRALANPLDTVALYELLASPLVGLTVDGLALLGRADSWDAADLGAPDSARLSAFGAWFDAERRAIPGRRLDELISRAVDESGYREALEQLPGGRRRVANVEKLMRLARDFEADQGRDLRSFLDHITARALDVPREPDAPADVHDAIRLMTIHTAKGLEADVVCIADLGRAPSLGNPLIQVHGDQLGLRVPWPDGTRSPALQHDALTERRRAADAAEEDRILYVAMTRARERLLLSAAADLDRWPALPGSSPIAWLGPALVADLPAGPVAVIGDAFPLRVEQRRAGANGASGAAGATVPRLGLTPARWPPPVSASMPPPSPVALSYTALSSHAACGYRYYLQRVLRLPDVAEPGGKAGVGARERGILVHALLERLDFARPVVPNAQQAAGALGLRATGAELADVEALIDSFAGSAVCRRLAGSARVDAEQPFAFELEGTLVTGVMDAVALEPDRMLVVDYKSDRVGDADLDQLTTRDYAIQRHVYALAALRQGAPAVEVLHCYLDRVDEPVSALFDDVEALEALVRPLLEDVLAGAYTVASHPHLGLCAGCPGRARLCSWGPEVTGRY